MNHAYRGTIGGTVRFLTDQMIADFLGGGHGKKSVFERYGFTEPDGSPIVVTSHQFRLWLNTLAQEGGMSQELVARWSGRKDVAQNSAYDHVSGRKLGERLREMVLAGDMRGPIAEATVRLPPADRQAFLAAEVASAHVTELGLCVHDWSLAPMHGDCANCGEHVVEKGNPVQRREAERQAAEVSKLGKGRDEGRDRRRLALGRRTPPEQLFARKDRVHPRRRDDTEWHPRPRGLLQRR